MIAALISAIKQFLGNVTSAGDGVTIGGVTQWVADIVNAIVWVMGQELGSVQYSEQYATQIGKDFEQIEGYQIARWNALLTRILPNTVANAVGYVYSNGIDPLRHDVASLHTQVNALVELTNSLESWRNSIVDPDLAYILYTLNAWGRDYGQAWATLDDWLLRPGDFGQWAAAPVIGPLVAYLADPDHAQTRDNLTGIISGAWSEQPDKTFDDFLKMLVS